MKNPEHLSDRPGIGTAVAAGSVKPLGADKLTRARALEVMILLGAINCLNMIDRNMPFILIGGIRKDLHLSDTQIGLLGGIFAVVYTIGGLPMGRLADRGLARPVIGAAVAFWSILTAAAGLAQNFVHLALARIGVAAGEAGAAPGSHAIISEHFPVERRATMLSVFSMGAPLGAMFALIVGGALADRLGWRATFIIMGVPGLLLALVAWWRLPSSRVLHSEAPLPGIFRSVGGIFSIPAFSLNTLGCAGYGFAAYAIVIWLPSFFQRAHGLSAAQTGLWLGLVTGIAGLIGMPVCGYLADRLSVRNISWRLRVPAICLGVSAPFMLATITVSSWKVAILLYCVPQALTIACLGPAFAAAHAVVAPQMRGLASSCLLAVMTLLGAGLGPPLVGAISDWLGAAQDTHSLARAMLVLPAALVLASLFFWLASRRLSKDLYPSS